jgi:hypothetical protein
LVAAKMLRSKIIINTLGDVMTGHESKNKTKECIISCFWWPGMDTELEKYIKRCDKCQRARKEIRGSTTFACPLPQCSEPSVSELRFCIFEPSKSVLFYLLTLNGLNALRTSTVYAIFAFFAFICE